MKGTVKVEKKFSPITVEFVIETKAELEEFLSMFGKTGFCYDTYSKLNKIKQETF
jgi:hypothetical protein